MEKRRMVQASRGIRGGEEGRLPIGPQVTNLPHKADIDMVINISF